MSNEKSPIYDKSVCTQPSYAPIILRPFLLYDKRTSTRFQLKKLNFRLVKTSEYLPRFCFDIHYKPGKTNTIPDVLFRFSSKKYQFSNTQNSLTVLSIQFYSVNLIYLFPKFKTRLKQKYEDEPQWKRVIRTIRKKDELEKNTVTLPFQLIDGILYFKNDDRNFRLCVPSNKETKVFRLTHDEMGYPEYTKIHERLTNGLYFRKMAAKFHKFIRHCPKCQIHQIPKHRFYGSLQPKFSPVRQFHIFTIDFILALPISVKSFNCAMSVTDKFNKAVTHVFGITSWSANNGRQRCLTNSYY